MQQKQEISASLMDHFACMQTFYFICTYVAHKASSDAFNYTKWEYL